MQARFAGKVGMRLRGRMPGRADASAFGNDPRASLGRAEALAGVRRLDLRTRGFVDSLFSGDRASVFLGRGFEFSHVREYQPGDDVRSIDWKVTARRGTPFVRRFVEERDLLVALVVDVSASGRLAPGERSVGEIATELAAALAFAAVRTNDRVALFLVSDHLERAVLPGAGQRHVLRLLEQLLIHPPGNRGTDLATAMEGVTRVLRGRSVLFLMSDFIQPDPSGRLADRLREAGRRHDLVALRISSGELEELPDVGWMEMTDPESGRRILLDTSSSRVRSRYVSRLRETRAALADQMAGARGELVEVPTRGDSLGALYRFFASRREGRG